MEHLFRWRELQTPAQNQNPQSELAHWTWGRALQRRDGAQETQTHCGICLWSGMDCCVTGAVICVSVLCWAELNCCIVSHNLDLNKCFGLLNSRLWLIMNDIELFQYTGSEHQAGVHAKVFLYEVLDDAIYTFEQQDMNWKLSYTCHTVYYSKEVLWLLMRQLSMRQCWRTVYQHLLNIHSCFKSVFYADGYWEHCPKSVHAWF